MREGVSEVRPTFALAPTQGLTCNYGPGMAHVAAPGPFDFALSTERFRAFGVDRANVWHEGGLHRVVNGREVRIEPAPGGVDVEPFDGVALELLGIAFDLEGFYAWAEGDEVLRHLVVTL